MSLPPFPGPAGFTDQAVRRVVDTLSTAELAAVAGGRARLELHVVGAAGPDPAQLGLYTEPLPVITADAYAAPAAPEQAPSARARRAPATPVPVRDHGVEHGVDIAAAVARVNAAATPSAVEEYLSDPAFSLAVLKQVARALGPTVPRTGRSKSEVRRDIVAGTVGFRSRSAAMSDGAWA